MKIEYDTTLGDIADAHLRMAAKSKMAGRSRWQEVFWIALFTGLILFMYLTLRGATVVERSVVSILGIVVGAGWHWFTYRGSAKRRAVKYMREQMQSDGPFPFAVELRDDCIWTRQGTTQISFDWGNVAEMVDAEDAVEFRMHDGGFVIVRNKGFQTAESREEFKRAANQRLNATARKLAVR